MSREKILGYQGNIIGYSETCGTKTYISKVNGPRLGYYDSSNDFTHTINGKKITRGNDLRSMLN